MKRLLFILLGSISCCANASDIYLYNTSVDECSYLTQSQESKAEIYSVDEFKNEFLYGPAEEVVSLAHLQKTIFPCSEQALQLTSDALIDIFVNTKIDSQLFSQAFLLASTWHLLDLAEIERERFNDEKKWETIDYLKAGIERDYKAFPFFHAYSSCLLSVDNTKKQSYCDVLKQPFIDELADIISAVEVDPSCVIWLEKASCLRAIGKFGRYYVKTPAFFHHSLAIEPLISALTKMIYNENASKEKSLAKPWLGLYFLRNIYLSSSSKKQLIDLYQTKHYRPELLALLAWQLFPQLNADEKKQILGVILTYDIDEKNKFLQNGDTFATYHLNFFDALRESSNCLALQQKLADPDREITYGYYPLFDYVNSLRYDTLKVFTTVFCDGEH